MMKLKATARLTSHEASPPAPIPSTLHACLSDPGFACFFFPFFCAKEDRSPAQDLLLSRLLGISAVTPASAEDRAGFQRHA